MPYPLPAPTEGWDGMMESTEPVGNQGMRTPQPWYPEGLVSHDSGYEATIQESSLDGSASATGHEAVEVFEQAVDTARQRIRQSLAGSEEVGEAVSLKLTLDLKGKGLQDLPDEIVDIVKGEVESLKLDYNQISHIPYRFDQCTVLKYLNLCSNRFKDFPEAVYKLPHLEVLDLSRNQLASIPDGVKNMKALRVFSIGNNNIETLPPSIALLDIRILKLAGNPLAPGLKKIVEGGNASPTRAALQDHEKEVIMTRKLKKYLQTADNTKRDSGGFSSEGTVSTPRAPKRTLSSRFPVRPSNSESESASDINLTIRSPGFAKPPIPARSHYRVISGQYDGNINAALRRPGLAPMSNGNERNRSNSESILQATQTNRSKRMGIITRKQSDLVPVVEGANRNSFHSRGQSDGSALSDRYDKTARIAEIGVTSPLRNERHQGMFVRRLSSLPEQKRESAVPDRVVEGAKGVMYSLHLVHPHLSTWIPVVKERTNKNKLSLEKIYKHASNQFKVLDLALHELEARVKMKGGSRFPRNTKFLSACEDIMTTYQQLGEYLLGNISRLVSGGDQRYVRTLVLLLYGSVIEERNAICNFISTIVEAKAPRSGRAQILSIQEEPHQLRDRSVTPIKQRPNPERRLRNGISKQPPVMINALSSSNGVPTAIPLNVNGRSRSNSRTGPFFHSNASSVVNTPRSGDSFMFSGYGTPRIRSRSNSALGHNVQTVAEVPDNPEHDAIFERIFIVLSHCVEHCQRIIPLCLQQFTSCLDVAHMSFTSQKIHLLWSTLISRCNVCLETSTAMHNRLSNMKLHDPDVRLAKDFWRLCSKLCLSLEKFMYGVREARLLQLISMELLKVIHPLQKSFSEAGRCIKSSPWEPLTRENNQQQPQNHDSSYRHRARTGSGNSPYATNVPATPLSAALGPAAQATVPTSAAFDRSFAGDVFQRADELLRTQQTMIHRR